MTQSEWITVALFSLTVVFGVIGFFIVRFFNSTENHLASIDGSVGKLSNEVTAVVAREESRDRRLSEHEQILSRHSDKLSDHDARLRMQEDR